jgi:uncharacterized membrane protein
MVKRSTRRNCSRVILSLIALAVTGVEPARAAAGDEKLDPQTKARIERFERGPATIDVSKYPPGIQQEYETFSQKCSQCHKLSRPLNCDYTTLEEWTRCIRRMRHKSGSNISSTEGEKICQFLVYHTRPRPNASAGVKLGQARDPTTQGEKGPAVRGGTGSDLVLFLGHFHPLLVHLPIGGLVLLGILEMLARFSRFKNAAHNSRLLLGLVSVSALITAFCGWLLSHASGYDAQLLRWHKWTGLCVAVSCLVAFVLRLLERQRAYAVCLCATLAALIVASHLGGSLTHGSDFLTRYAPEPVRSLLGERPALATTPANRPEPAPQLAFAEAAQPILVRRCSGCHGEQTQKNGLRLDSLQGLIKGGESGPAFVAGNANESRLIQRMLLPSPAEHHMPPAAEPQPTPGEIEVLQSWINTGAQADLKVAAPKPSEPRERAPQGPPASR